MNETKKTEQQRPKMSLFSYLSSEVTRGYVLDHDEERYTTRRQKMYTFMKIPRELEKFMSYGFFHCLDSFLFVFTFLPIRFALALMALIVRAPLVSLGLVRPFHGRLLFPAEKIDLLKGLIIGVCAYVMSHIDTSMMYHLIKSQSVIKLYLFYNMLEVGDRLFSAFGQDTIDALFWTATEPTLRKREHIGVIPHFLLTITYVIMHTLLVLLQATTLNVAINASNKALLTIMMSNNFVELKGSVFKKFDKNNLFQVSCSDVRERFHLFALLFIVVVQTMKEYGWREESFWSLAPDCLLVLGAEFLVDWIKHAFITRFNEVSAEVYKDYTTYLAYDLAQTKQKHAFSDHSDIVSRRMGFIPLPLGVVMIRVITNAVRGNSRGAPVICLLAYLCLVTFRILASIVILGKACDLIDTHQQTKPSPLSPIKNPDKTGKGKKAQAQAQHQDVSKQASSADLQTRNEIVDNVSAEVERSSDLFAESLRISLNNHSAFFEGTPISLSSNPPYGLVEKLDSISKSSSVILEEEEDLNIESRSAPSLSDDENTSASTHRWSNSRSSKFLVARGEFNKSVYSDSRRRPLSCTPPSTSLSTSASVEEDDDVIVLHSQQHQDVLRDHWKQTASQGHCSGVEDLMPDEVTSSSLSQDEGTVVQTDITVSEHSAPEQSTFLPDLLQLGQQKQMKQQEECTAGAVEQPQTVSASSSDVIVDNVTVTPTVAVDEQERKESRGSCDSFMSQSSIGPRSMSSPDFLLQYQMPYDEERDWPQVEREDEVDDAGDQTQKPPLALARDPSLKRRQENSNGTGYATDDQTFFQVICERDITAWKQQRHRRTATNQKQKKIRHRSTVKKKK